MLTDELASAVPDCSQDCHVQSADQRIVFNTILGADPNGYAYDFLQSARVKALQAQQALQLYASNTPSVPRAWQGEMYALEGYTVLMFAEGYCSGIPLTSVSLVGAQALTRGFTTEELFAKAVALFDSASALSSDSVRIASFAAVGRARALLGLGKFAAADSAVRNVSTDFVYLINGVTSSADGSGYNYLSLAMGTYRAQDNEGGNGLVWSTDPRAAIVIDTALAGAMLWPSKYHITSLGILDPTYTPPGAPVRLADGLEARLIQAEAALDAGSNNWLAILNSLRTTCVGLAACAPVPGLTTASLPPLNDPGTTTSRVDLVMKERAMWLYLTGHREGDLRRLARVYNRDPNTLWPSGTILAPAFPPTFPSALVESGQPYGTDMVFGPDVNEQLRNPLYGGCYDTNP
jgi:hypothetical protein